MQVWTLDLKNGSGAVSKGATDLTADVTLIISDKNFVELTQGHLNPQEAFMGGKLKLKGNMALAMKIGTACTDRAKSRFGCGR